MKEYAELGKKLVEEGWMIPISHEIRHVRVEAHVGGVKDLSFGHRAVCRPLAAIVTIRLT